jgi:DNA repair exonuclease SbcCD ATPase subunit
LNTNKFTLIQVENQRMRMRIKGLDETIEILRSRSVELQKELEMAKLRAGIVAGMENKENEGAEAIGEQQFSAMIEGYLQEMEALKTKLIELNSTNEALRKQNHHFRLQLEQQGMATNSLPGSPYMPSGGGAPISQNSLIKSAKADIARAKALLGGYFCKNI